MTREEKAAHWQGVLERWRSSGQVQRQFCQENKLSLWQLRYWSVRERQRARDAAVAEFAPVAVSAGEGSGLWLRLGPGAELRIDPGFDAATLRRVLGCLGPC